MSQSTTQSGKKISLKYYLQKHKTIPEKSFTHTTMGEPPKSYPGSYCIEDSDFESFFEVYSNTVFKHNISAHLTERHRDESPILIDLDFRHQLNSKSEVCERKYTKEFIMLFLQRYMEIMDSMVDIPDDRKVAFVLEKDHPVNHKGKTLVKDGIHVIFPYIVTTPKPQYIWRYKSIVDEKIINLMEPLELTNTLDDVFDIAVIERNNWQMYGSCKPSNQTYKLTHVFKFSDGNKKIEELENNWTDGELVRLLSIRNFDKTNIVDFSDIQEILDAEFEGLPQKQQVKKQRKVKAKKSPAVKNYIDDDEDLEFIKAIVDILSPTRADKYDDWMRVGWCLHNIDYRLLEDWVNFSKKSEKYVEGECEKEWCAMKNEGLGLGSLYLWAKEDNVEKYTDLSRNNLRQCMINSLTIAPNDIAKVVKHMYKNEFVCSSSKHNVWFQFKNHRWREIDNAVELRKRLSHEVVDEYLKLNVFISKQAYEVNDAVTSKEKQLHIENLKIINKIIDKLKTTPFKKNVIVECSELFHDDIFETRLDKKLHLIGFENGVYDLDKLEFREGVYEDYISMTTGINFYDYDDDDENLIDVIKFVEQVLPKHNVREYVLKCMSTFLHGAVKEEKFHIWTGCGGNGKSKLIDLFQNAFRDYCCPLPVTHLTKERGRSEGANSALATTKNKRFVVLQEPESNEELKVGELKMLTGGDTVPVRDLYKKQEYIKPQFKMVLTCNSLPSVSSSDRGVWRRISVVEFISVFTHNPDPNEKYQFMIDESLGEKLASDGPWAEAFMYLLIEYYKKYLKNGAKEPAEVLKYTEEYQSESDFFIQFMNEKIVELDDSEVQLKLDEIYYEYQLWFKQTKGQGTKCPSRKDLKTNLSKKFGAKSVPNNRNAWLGLAIKESLA
jgi:P4 family phage/plasmid primase-like protien